MIRAFASREFGLFLLTGGIAAAANFGSRIVYSHWLGYSAAIVVAYCTGMVVAFVLARLFVFRAARRSAPQSAAIFALVNLFGVLQTWAVSLLCVHIVFPAMGFDWHNEATAHLIGVVVPVFSSYLGHKYWSFGNTATHTAIQAGEHREQ